MCTLLFSWKKHPDYPLILIANRDEFYERQTQHATWWEDHPNILGGRDLKAGGTWMGMNKKGEFAALTNYRKLPIEEKDTSRGQLVKDFLAEDVSPGEYLKILNEVGDKFEGFSLMFGNSDSLYCYSNKGTSLELEPNIYGLSNHLLDTPWTKVEKGKSRFSQEIKQGHLDNEALFKILGDEQKAPDSELPETGLDLERERMVSSIFIKSENYGTRISSILTLNKNGKMEFHERSFIPENDQAFSFQINKD